MILFEAEREMAIKFYSLKDTYGEFSYFSKHGFTYAGLFWPTSEHYFQAQKFESIDLQNLVRTASSPMEAAIIGRNRDHTLRHDWEEVKNQVMMEAVLLKFSSHRNLQELLLSTKDEELIEETSHDYYWGCGKDGSGKNVLGKILMIVREEINQQRQHGVG